MRTRPSFQKYVCPTIEASRLLLTCRPLKLDSVAMGKPMSVAKGDIEDARNITDYFSGLVELASGQASVNSSDHLNMLIRQPYGVVAAIIPWNFPTLLVCLCCINMTITDLTIQFCHEIAPACGAGNAMILKVRRRDTHTQ